jgi:hypothetical protein
VADPLTAPGVWLVHVPDTDTAPRAVPMPDEDSAMVAAAILLGRHPDADVHLVSGLAGGGARRIRRVLDPA